jgi:hypothetical protein
MSAEELTDRQSEQVDHIHSTAYNAMKELLGEEIEWDMEWIGELCDAMADIAVRFFHKDEMEVYPYIELDVPLGTLDKPTTLDDLDAQMDRMTGGQEHHHQGDDFDEMCNCDAMPPHRHGG